MDKANSRRLSNVAPVVKVRLDRPDHPETTADPERTVRMARTVRTAKMASRSAVEPAPGPRHKPEPVLEAPTQEQLLAPVPEPEEMPLLLAEAMDHHHLNNMEHRRLKNMPRRHQPRTRNRSKSARCNAKQDHPDRTEQWDRKDHPDPRALPAHPVPMANEANVVWSVTKPAPVHPENKDRRDPKETTENSISLTAQPDHPARTERTDRKDLPAHPAKTEIPDQREIRATLAKPENPDQSPNPVAPDHPATRDRPAVTEAAITAHHHVPLQVIKNTTTRILYEIFILFIFLNSC
jgi:hypothetical protein